MNAEYDTIAASAVQRRLFAVSTRKIIRAYNSDMFATMFLYLISFGVA